MLVCDQCKQPIDGLVMPMRILPHGKPAYLHVHDRNIVSCRISDIVHFCTVACARDWIFNVAHDIGESRPLPSPEAARAMCHRILEAAHVDDMGGCPLCCS